MRNLSGMSFALHATAWPDPSDLCAWAGPSCSFNDLVRLLEDSRRSGHPGHGMALGAGGLLSFTQRRARMGMSSDSMFEVCWEALGSAGGGRGCYLVMAAAVLWGPPIVGWRYLPRWR